MKENKDGRQMSAMLFVEVLKDFNCQSLKITKNSFTFMTKQNNMKSKLNQVTVTLFIAFQFMIFNGYSQIKCGYDEVINNSMQNDPNFINNEMDKNNAIDDYINTHMNQNAPPFSYPSTYIIPVVVHIVRNNTSEPTISYAQVQSQIDALNVAFSGGNGG